MNTSPPITREYTGLAASYSLPIYQRIWDRHREAYLLCFTHANNQLERFLKDSGLSELTNTSDIGRFKRVWLLEPSEKWGAVYAKSLEPPALRNLDAQIVEQLKTNPELDGGILEYGGMDYSRRKYVQKSSMLK